MKLVKALMCHNWPRKRTQHHRQMLSLRSLLSPRNSHLRMSKKFNKCKYLRQSRFLNHLFPIIARTCLQLTVLRMRAQQSITSHVHLLQIEISRIYWEIWKNSPLISRPPRIQQKKRSIFSTSSIISVDWLSILVGSGWHLSFMLHANWLDLMQMIKKLLMKPDKKQNSS